MPISSAVERRVGIKNTKAFIDANYVEVQLRRPVKKRTEAGGRVNDDPILVATQRFRIVPMSGLVWDRARSTPDEGRIDDVTEELICLPDADVQKNDYFPHESGFFRIDHVSPVRGYRRECRLRWTDTEPKV